MRWYTKAQATLESRFYIPTTTIFCNVYKRAALSAALVSMPIVTSVFHHQRGHGSMATRWNEYQMDAGSICIKIISVPVTVTATLREVLTCAHTTKRMRE